MKALSLGESRIIQQQAASKGSEWKVLALISIFYVIFSLLKSKTVWKESYSNKKWWAHRPSWQVEQMKDDRRTGGRQRGRQHSDRESVRKMVGCCRACVSVHWRLAPKSSSLIRLDGSAHPCLPPNLSTIHATPPPSVACTPRKHPITWLLIWGCTVIAAGCAPSLGLAGVYWLGAESIFGAEVGETKMVNNPSYSSTVCDE